MESVGGDANSVFHEDLKFFKSDTFESETIFVTFEILRKCSENVFENYKSFVTVEVQSHSILSFSESN